MHEHPQDDPELLSEIEKLGYDPRDVSVEKTPWHAVGLYVSVAASMGLAWLVMAYFDRAQAWLPEEEPTQARDRMPESPYPLLQSNLTAKTDIEDLRYEERVKTETAGWLDKETGQAYIPIDDAIELVLKEGMPVTPSIEVPESLRNDQPEATDAGAVAEGMEDGQ